MSGAQVWGMGGLGNWRACALVTAAAVWPSLIVAVGECLPGMSISPFVYKKAEIQILT